MGERLANGVKLGVDKTTLPGTTYTDVAELTSIDFPSESRPAIDSTALADTARQYKVGLYEAGEVSAEFYFDPDNDEHIFLRDQVKGGAKRAYRITIPADPDVAGAKDWYCDFVAFVTEFTPAAGGDDELLSVSVTLKVTGEVTYEEAA
jgi:hypothetical protein